MSTSKPPRAAPLCMETAPIRNATSEVMERKKSDNIDSTRKRKKEHTTTNSRKKHKSEDKDSFSSKNSSKRISIEPKITPQISDAGVALEEVASNNEKPPVKPRQEEPRETSGSVRENKKLKKSRKEASQEHENDVGDDETTRKHSKILSKYQKSLKRRSETHRLERNEHVPVVEAPKIDELVPFALPEAQPQSEPLDASAVLPSWLSKPTIVFRHAHKPFKRLDLDKSLTEKLRAKGFEEALPVQAAILPLLLPRTTRHPGDLCISAATGSGKTLGYALPIIQSIVPHATTRLRALVIVPTRELVHQVRDTFTMLTSGTKISIGTAVGTHHFELEQKTLIEKTYRYDPQASNELRVKLEQKVSLLGEDDSEDGNEVDAAEELLNLLPYHVPDFESNVDILIATPGRLVDHIKSTSGFKLNNLEWLVIDEADRLLDASFQQWVDILTSAIDEAKKEQMKPEPFSIFDPIQKRPLRKVVLSATMTRDIGKLNYLQLQNPKLVVLEGGKEFSQIVDTEKYAGATGLPSTLHERAVPVGDGSDKPLYLLYILQQLFSDIVSSRAANMDGMKGATALKDDGHLEMYELDESDSESSVAESTESQSMGSSVSSSASPSTPRSRSSPLVSSNALIFTSSNESAHRLHRLLTHLAPDYKKIMTTLTKSSTSRSTAKAIASFQASELRILIATDRASRGLDLSNLHNVINYDIPHSITSYVHRVGRTARAGAPGTAWTLVEDREAAWYWNEVAKGKEIDRGGKTVERKRIELKGLGEGAPKAYQAALEALEKDVKLDIHA